MFFFCFSKGVVGYDSQPRSGVNVQLVLGKGRCIYAKSVESREPFWSLHPVVKGILDYKYYKYIITLEN